MMFPRVRMSDLVRERKERAAAFDRSREEMARVLRDELRPVNLIKRHPGLVMGAAASLMSVFGLTRVVTGSSNGNGTSAKGHSRAKNDLVGKLISFGSGLAARKMGIVGAAAMRFVVSSLFSRRKGA